jgi:phenylpyruvate tautomerase PptA (4-oxalocrotonate tautomerase family)
LPLWKIYHPKDAYTVEEKKAFANAISDVYGRQMPRFYVGVMFQEVEADNFYIGGEPNGNFVRIWVDHIARTLPDDEARRNFTKYIAKVVAPWVENRSWELHVGRRDALRSLDHPRLPAAPPRHRRRGALDLRQQTVAADARAAPADPPNPIPQRLIP